MSRYSSNNFSDGDVGDESSVAIQPNLNKLNPDLGSRINFMTDTTPLAGLLPVT